MPKANYYFPKNLLDTWHGNKDDSGYSTISRTRENTLLTFCFCSNKEARAMKTFYLSMAGE